MRTLVIDDSTTMRAMHAAVLQQMDIHSIAEAGDGIEGLEKAETYPPELVLVDGAMPNMDGLAFVRAFRERSPHVPIVMIADDSGTRHAIEAINAGVDAYLTKPFTPDLLAQRIEDAISIADAEAELEPQARAA